MFAETTTQTSEGIADGTIDVSQLDGSGVQNLSTIASQPADDTNSINASATTIEPTAGTIEKASSPRILVEDVEGKISLFN